MKKFLIITVTCMLAISTPSCKKDHAEVSLSSEEKKLLGRWDLRKQVIEQTGQPTVINLIGSSVNCFVEFKEQKAALLDPASPVFSNTKYVQDNKDCTWLLNSWKIDNGKLLLASLDTAYADILLVTADSLAFRLTDHDNSAIQTIYQFKKY